MLIRQKGTGSVPSLRVCLLVCIFFLLLLLRRLPGLRRLLRRLLREPLLSCFDLPADQKSREALGAFVVRQMAYIFASVS